MTVTRLKFRIGTTNEWSIYNPILSLGEPGFDITAKRFKMGDGVNPWANLPFMAADPAQLTSILAQMTSAADATNTAAAQAAVSAAAAQQAATDASAPVTTNSAVATAINTAASAAQQAVDSRVTNGVSGATGDSAIASRVSAAGSATQAAVDARVALGTGVNTASKVDKDTVVVNALDHGVVRSTTVDQAAALNAAATATLAIGPEAILFIPWGTYRIDSTVTFKCSVDASHALLDYRGTGVAVVAGDTTAGGSVQNRTFDLPMVAKPLQGWNDNSLGVDLVNLMHCRVRVPMVQFFERGLRCRGLNAEFSFNAVDVGLLAFNHRQFLVDSNIATATLPAGLVRQNLFQNARLHSPLSATGSITATADDPAASGMEIGITAGSTPDNNTFLNFSVGNAIPAYYRLNCNGLYNQFINCRWETNGGSSRVLWGATAKYNWIQGGTEADQLVETFTSGSTGNTIYGARGGYIDASNVSGLAFPVDAAAGFKVVTGWTNNSVFANYNAATGAWIPRQGRWRISATLSLDSPTTGTATARLMRAGTDILDFDRQNANPVTVLKLATNARFDGTESLQVQIRQETNVARTLSTNPGFVNLSAEYLGP